MARPRKSEYAWLPKGFYVMYGKIVYQHYEEGHFISSEIICKADLPKSVIWKKIELHKNALPDTLEWLIKKYLESSQFSEKSKSTQQDYVKYSKNLINEPIKGGKTLGSVSLQSITPRVIRNYLDSKEAKIYANRHVQFLKIIFNWGRERFDNIKTNPCENVKMNKQNPRTRYIEDWEFELVKNLSTVPYIPIFMEFAYLCRARWSEISALTRDNILDRGIYLTRSKGSKDEVTTWTPRLQKAVADAKKLNSDRFSKFLIHDKDGLSIRYAAFSSSWQRLMKKALQNGLKESFTFHDIKAKGVSDHVTKESGHRTERMKAVYDRKVSDVISTK